MAFWGKTTLPHIHTKAPFFFFFFFGMVLLLIICRKISLKFFALCLQSARVNFFVFFSGIEVKPGKPYTHKSDDSNGRLHISMVLSQISFSVYIVIVFYLDSDEKSVILIIICWYLVVFASI